MADRKKPLLKAPAVPEYVSVDAFLQTAHQLYDFSHMQEAGFKNLMSSKGMKSAPGQEFYLPYLKKYLGIKD